MELKRFITFEGGEGAGKSTQIRLLAERLASQGETVVLTREPGGSTGAESLRRLLVEGAADRWSPLSEALLLYAARSDHLERTIRPALARGDWVLSDRFADSTRAYQGAGGHVPLQVLDELDRAVVGETQPGLTLIFDLDEALGLERAAQRGGGEARFEAKGQRFHKRLRARFLSIAQAEPNRCVVVDASRPATVVARQVLDAVVARFPALRAVA